MTRRFTLRSTAMAAIAALAAFSAQAMEATQWNPQVDRNASASTDATQTQTAWAVNHGEATQFHDAISRDTMTARAAVRSDYKLARSRGLLNDTGEGGATDRVLAQREAFAQEEHDRIVALNTTAPDEDQIGDMIAAMTPDETLYPDSFAAYYNEPLR